MAKIEQPLNALASLAVPDSAITKPGVAIQVQHPIVMTDLRVRSSANVTAAEAVIGAALPSLGSSSNCADGDILRLGPDQWLLVSMPGGRWNESMVVPGGSLCDVSCGRVVVRVTGRDVRSALAKGCMLDLHEQAFAAGACAQTVIAKVNVIVHRLRRPDLAYDLYATRSAAGSFWHWLTEASREFGCAAT